MPSAAGKNSSKVTIGVLDYQGGVEEHFELLSRVPGVKARLVEYPEQLEELQGLIIPGGESTTMLKLMSKSGMDEAIRQFAASKRALWGTCAGLIVLSNGIVGEEYSPLGLIDIQVQRNAYGSQLDSFITREKIPAVSGKAVELVFIRAPRIESCGEGVEALAQVNGATVFARNDRVMVTSFHPELTRDTSFHKYFAQIVRDSQ